VIVDVEEWADKERRAKKRVEEIHDAGWMRLQKNSLTIDGEEFERYSVVHCGAIAVLPVTDEGNLILERQYRYPIDEILLEIPAGRLDPGEEPAVAARRELREEIGKDCKELEPMGLYLPSPGYCTEKVYLFVAKGLFDSPLKGDRGEVIETVELSPTEAIAAVVNGLVPDGKTALLLLKYIAMSGPGGYAP